MFIKKLFENKIDNSVHKQFVRFGKGSYNSRAIINVKKWGNKIKVKTSSELANDLVEFISSLAEKFSVSGVVFSKEIIQGFKFKKKPNILVCRINKEMSAQELKELSIKAYATLLDCMAPGISLKIKKRFFSSPYAKCSTVEEFCVLDLDKKFWQKFHEEFLFDLPLEFKKARIEHTYIIKDIIIPKELKNEKDFEKIRLMAKRKGKIIRKIIVDSREIIKEKDFEA